MKRTIFLIFLTLATFQLLTAQTPGGTMHANNWSTLGKIYFDETLSADEVFTDTGNLTQANINLNIKLEGPVNIQENSTGKFRLSITTEENAPNSVVQDYIHKFKILFVTDEEYFEIGPVPEYRVRLFNDYNLQLVRDLPDRERKLLKYFGKALPAVVSNLPIVGFFYSISQNFYETQQWINTIENDWLSIWEFDYNYDSYPLLNPICVEPASCSYARAYQIDIPFTKISSQGNLYLYIDKIGVKRDFTSNQTDLISVFKDKKFTIIDEGNKSKLNTNITNKNFYSEQQLEIPNISAQLEVIAEINEQNNNSYLDLTLTPKSQQNFQSLYLRDINVGLCYEKNTAFINRFPSYFNYDNQKVPFNTIKQQSGNEALTSWLKSFVSFIPGFGLLFGLTDIFEAYSTAGESIGFLKSIKTNWQQQNNFNVYQLPPFKNSGSEGKEQGCRIQIPLAGNVAAFIPTEVLLSCDVGWKDAAGNDGYRRVTYSIDLPKTIKKNDTADITLGFIIDSSGSMSSNDPHDMRKEILRILVNNRITPDENIILVDFDSNADFINKNNFANWSKAGLLNSINTIDSNGGTNIELGLDVMKNSLISCSAVPENTAVLLLTDGNGDYSDGAEWYVQQGIPVNTISFVGQVNDNLLLSIANQTGGEYLRANHASDIFAILSNIISGASGGNTLFSYYHNILQGQTILIDFFIDSIMDNMYPQTNWPGSKVTMTLISPSGKRYSDTGANGEWFNGDNFTTANIKNPEVGKWSAEIQGVTLPAGGETFRFNVYGKPDLIFDFVTKTEISEVLKGPIILEFESNHINLATSVDYKVSVLQPDGKTVELSDKIINNSLAFVPRGGKGIYAFNAVLEGIKKDGLSFQRYFDKHIYIGDYIPEYISTVHDVQANYVYAAMGKMSGNTPGLKFYIFRGDYTIESNLVAIGVINYCDQDWCTGEITNYYTGNQIQIGDIIMLDEKEWQRD